MDFYKIDRWSTLVMSRATAPQTFPPPHPQLGFEYLKKFDTSLITFNILKDIIKIVAFMCKFLIITHKTVMG